MRSIPHLFLAQADRWESRPLAYGKANLHWRPLTWRQVARRSLAIAEGLISFEIEQGQRGVLWMKSSPEWMLCDLGTLSAGMINVPIHDGASDQEVIYLLRDSGAVVVFVQDIKRARRLDALSELLPELRYVFILDAQGDPSSSVRGEKLSSDHLAAIRSSYLLRDIVVQQHDEKQSHLAFYSLEQLEERTSPEGVLEQRLEQLNPQDIMTLQYTSGTTGEPKGVMLTHQNILSNCQAAIDAVPITSDDVLLSFLPLSHSFERVAGYYMPMLFGSATLYFSEGYGRLIRNLNEVSPTIMTGVPRIYEKIYARFRGKRGAQGRVQRLLTRWALRLDQPLKRDEVATSHRLFSATSYLQSIESFSAPLRAQGQRLNRYLFSEFRQRLGGRLRLMVSGGAPLDVEVARFFHAAGLLILEGYGLSETGPVLTVNRPSAYRFGSVGQPLLSVDIKLADDGEILAQGPNVTQGYFRKSEETQVLFNEDGWLCTGDVGRFDQEGYLYITGRKKDIFKSAGGKLIAPQFIEHLFNSSPLIEQTYVIGDKRPYCVAFIVPSQTELKAWAQDIGYPLAPQGRKAWVKDLRVIDLFEREVERLNQRLSRHETIKRFRLCSESFIGGELTTASLKIKRDAALALYHEEIETLYGAQSRVEASR